MKTEKIWLVCGLLLIFIATITFAEKVSLMDQPETWDVNYTYLAGDRRDPFVPVIGPKAPLPGALTVGNAVLVGISRTPSGFVAIMKGQGKTLFLKEGDELYDGVVLFIRETEVIFKQDVRKTDPASPISHREVIKKLHQQS